MARIEFSSDVVMDLKNRPSPLAADSKGLAAARPERPSKPQPAAVAVVGDVPAGMEVPAEMMEDPRRRRIHWNLIPSWAISMLAHTGLLLLLAAFSLEPIAEALSVLVVSGTTEEPTDALEEFAIDSADAMQVEASDVDSVPEKLPTATTVTQELTNNIQLETSVQPSVELSSLTSSMVPSESLSATLSGVTQSLGSRSAKMKREMLERYGGNDASEKAVARALEWLAMHQLPDGSWTFTHQAVCRNPKCNLPGTEVNARNAATGLALLPFLGAGQTHVEGEYKQVVLRGLTYLLNSMKVEGGEFPTGSWHGRGDSMYGHGIASIAVCEAFGMTKDPVLAKPSQLALNFISYAQEPVLGGWQYSPRKGSDTSVVGWQLMALKSGAAGGLVIQPVTLRKADAFLNRVQMNQGAFYGYTGPKSNIDGSLATSACGLLCRMYMGWPKEHPALKEGVEYMVRKGPNPKNVYFNYYATQVIKQYGGSAWENWNPKMRDLLVKSQVTKEHASGSWEIEDGHIDRGGRLYVTCMSAMVLEVYYRYMPIYGEQTGEEAFQL